MLINGLKVTAEKNATFERRNPLDGTVATRAPAASPADAVMAVEAAAEAFKTWSETGPSERRMLLLKAAEKLEAKVPQFIEAVSAETGATGMWAGFNVMLAAGMIREAASLTTQVAGEVIPSDIPGSLSNALRPQFGSWLAFRHSRIAVSSPSKRFSVILLSWHEKRVYIPVSEYSSLAWVATPANEN